MSDESQTSRDSDTPGAANDAPRHRFCLGCGLGFDVDPSGGVDVTCPRCGALWSWRESEGQAAFAEQLNQFEQWLLQGLLDTASYRRLRGEYERRLEPYAPVVPAVETPTASLEAETAQSGAAGPEVDGAEPIGQAGPTWEAALEPAQPEPSNVSIEALSPPVHEPSTLAEPKPLPEALPPVAAVPTELPAPAEAPPEPVSEAPPLGPPERPPVEAPPLRPARPAPPASPRAAVPAPPRTIAPAPPRRDHPLLQWSRLGMALLSERGLRALLFLGVALVFAAAITLTVQAFRSGAPWELQQTLNVLTGLCFWLTGWYVRRRLGLRLSGGALMDVGLLWLPLSVGLASYHYIDARSTEHQILGIAYDAPLNWAIILGITAPVYAFAAVRYRLIIAAYLSAVAAGGTVTSLLFLNDAVPWGWRVAAAGWVGPALVLVALHLRRHRIDDLYPHMVALGHGWSPALLMILLAVPPNDPTWELGAFALAAPLWVASVTHALAFRNTADLLPRGYRYMLVATPAVALIVTLFDVDFVPLGVRHAALVPLAAAYLWADRVSRRARADAWYAPLGARGEAGSGLRAPLAAVAMGLALSAALYPGTSLDGAALTYTGLASVAALAVYVYRRAVFEALSAALAFFAAQLVLAALDVPIEWHGVALAAVVTLLVVGGWWRRTKHGVPTGLAFSWRALGPVSAVGVAASSVALLYPDSTAAEGVNAGQVQFFVGAPEHWMLRTLLLAAAYAVAARLFSMSRLATAASLLATATAAIALNAADVPIAWHGAALAIVAAGLMLGPAVARRLERARRTDEAPASEQGTLREAVLTVGVLVSFLALLYPDTLVAGDGHWVTRLDFMAGSATPWAARSGLLALTYFGTANLYRRPLAEAVGAALSVLTTALTLSAADVPMAWHGAALGVVAGLALLDARLRGDREALAAARGLDEWLARAGPVTLVALATTVLALLYPDGLSEGAGTWGERIEWLSAGATAWTARLGAVAAAYAAAAAIYRRREFEYPATVLGLGATLTALFALDVPMRWHGVVLALEAVVLIDDGWRRPRALARRRSAWLGAAAPTALVGAFAAILAVTYPDARVAVEAAADDGVLRWTVDGAAGRAAASMVLAAGSLALVLRHRRREFEYAASMAFALAAIHAFVAAGLPDDRWDFALAILGVPFLVAGLVDRRRFEPAFRFGRWERLLAPHFLVGYVLLAEAASWPQVDPGWRAASWYIAVGGIFLATWVVRSSLPAYAASLLVVAPFASTLRAGGVEGPVRSLGFVLLAAIELTAGEWCLPRPGLEGGAWRVWRRAGAHAAWALPLMVAGSVILAGALPLWTGDVLAERGATGAPWPALAGAAAVIALAVRWRAPRLLHLAAWLVVPAFMLLSERGFHLGWGFTDAEHARNLGFFGLLYVGVGFALRRVPVPYRWPWFVAGYAVTLAAVVGSTPDTGVNALVTGGAAVLFGASAVLRHSGRHEAFDDWIRRRLAPRGAVVAAVGRSLLLAASVWLAVLLVVLLLALRDSPPNDFAVALAVLAFVYCGAGRLSRRVEPAYEAPWYLAGYAMSIVAPLVAWEDPNLRLAVFGATIALYAASAAISRLPIWAHVVVWLLPFWGLLALERFEAPRSLHGLAAVLLAAAYLLAGAAVQRRLNPTHWAPATAPIRPFAQPLFVGAFVLAAAGVAIVSGESSKAVAATSAAAAAFYLLATIVLSQAVLGYAVAVLAARAYVLGVTLTDLDPDWYGLALAPGVGVALVLGLLATARSTLAPRTIREVLGERLPTFESMAMPPLLLAAAGSIAIPLWSSPDHGPLAASLLAGGAVQLVIGWRLRSPFWVVPALGFLEGGYIEALAANGVWSTWPEAMVWLLAPTTLLVGAAEWLGWGGSWPAGLARASRRFSMPEAPVGESDARPSFQPLLNAGHVFGLHAAALLAVTLAVSARDPEHGLIVAVVDSLLLGAIAQRRQREAVAWLTLASTGWAAFEELRLIGLDAVPLDNAAVITSTAALGLRIAAEGLRRPATTRIWTRPLRLSSALGVVGPAMAGIWWADHDHATAEATAVAVTLALAGLHLVVEAYGVRSWALLYAGLALMDGAVLTQLVVLEVDQPFLFAAPAAAYLFLLSALERRRVGVDASPVIPALEWSGSALLLGVPLAQSLGHFNAGREVLVYRRVLLGLGLLVTVASIALQMKRPFAAGIVASLAALTLLLIEPVQHVNQWIIFGSIGLALIAFGVFAERSRARVIDAASGLRARLEQWS